MLKKLKNLINKLEGDFSISKAAIIIAISTLLAKILSLVKVNLFASRFAAGELADVYYASFRIPDFIFNLLVLGTISVAFIPVYTQLKIRNPEEAEKLASTVLHMAVLAMIVIIFIVFIFLDPLTRALFPGFSGEKLTTAISFSRILMISPIIFTVSSILSSILTSHKRFLIVSLAPSFYTVGIIIGIVCFYPYFGFFGLAYGVLLGALMHACLQIPELYSVGFHFRNVLAIKSSSFKRVIKLFLPRLFAFDSSNISLMIAGAFGSTLATGSIAVFSYAFDLQSVPLGIIAFSTAAAAFPALSDAWGSGNKEEYMSMLAKSIRRILFFILPIAIAMLVFRAQIVRILLGHGSFGWQETILTFKALGIFCVSLPAQALVPLLARAFYASHNTVVPVLVGFSSMVINATAVAILYSTYGVLGIAIGFSLGSVINCITLVVLIRLRVGKEVNEHSLETKFDNGLISAVSRIVIASFLMGISAYGTLYAVANFLDTSTTIGLLLQLGLASFAGSLTYIAVAYLLKIAEAELIVRLLRRLSTAKV